VGRDNDAGHELPFLPHVNGVQGSDGVTRATATWRVSPAPLLVATAARGGL
jgi:hypothetical protein